MSVKGAIGKAALELAKAGVSAFVTTAATNLANRAIRASPPPAAPPAAPPQEEKKRDG